VQQTAKVRMVVRDRNAHHWGRTWVPSWQEKYACERTGRCTEWCAGADCWFSAEIG